MTPAIFAGISLARVLFLIGVLRTKTIVLTIEGIMVVIDFANF